ncbi:sulfurtransferase TusA family protein [Hydrogenovibrio sp. 3SP14C1]|uniref:sulfurtransferase TusA family protein n=1 Tax=Hydrogenovibrio sp. 3SP14C1 TaxID=3038774 RepID=UPI002416C3F1|nr:sulfurtransferase TusA family protein [Hydrogenovibrio sp. 3SP14C1]MDG4811843.1 sulfurtransferase TusA family protein [Hydrogenovibrio sp. 3SP14C1]
MKEPFILDVKNLPCPLPLVKLKKALAEVDINQQSIQLTVTDQSALKDIPAFCMNKGLISFLSEQRDEEIVFLISAKG